MRSNHRSEHAIEAEELMAYLDGEIAAGRAAEIAQHMQQCAECKALAAGFRNLSQDLAAWEIESAPARLSEQVHEHAAAAESPCTPEPIETTLLQRWFAKVTAPKTRPWVWAGTGALGMAVVLIFAAIGTPNLMRARPEAMSGYMASRQAVPPSRAISSDNAQLERKREELQAMEQNLAQARMANSLDPSGDQRYSVNIVPGEERPAGGTPATKVTSSPGAAPMIARTASLSLVVKDFATVEAAVKAVVARHSGYIGELNSTTPPDAAKTFSVTLRVPSAQLDATLAELKQLGRVEQESQSGEEVTKQYVDLAARLKNARATEERLLGVLRNNTGKVKDVLEVENEISRVRGEIEEMEADRRALETRVDFGTVQLSVTEEYKASLNGAPLSMGTRLHNSFVAGYHSVVENIIGLVAWLLEAGPTLLLWAAILFFPARWAWRRLRRALKPASKPATI